MTNCSRTILTTLAVAGLLFCGTAFSTDLLIDVRSEAEYRESRIDGAINIPHNEIGSAIQKYEKNLQAPIKLYCRSGRRSALAKETLEKMGYTRVTNLGGIDSARKLLKESK